MKSPDSVTRELVYYHIKSLKLFSLMLASGTFLFSIGCVWFLSAGMELLAVAVPFVTAVSINALLVTRMQNGGKMGYQIILWLSWFTVVGISFFTGGLYSAFIYVLLLLLTSSYLFSRKLGNMWSVMIGLTLVCFYIINYKEWLPENIVPKESYDGFKLYTLIYLLYLFGVLSVFFHRSAEKARNSRKIIREQNSIIQWKNNQMMDNVRYAGKIQKSMLVKTSYMEQVFKEHSLFYQPKDHVGGDFYWVWKNDEGKIFWAIGDCTGHGVSGALMTMIGVSHLNDIVIDKKIEQAKDILEALNDSFLRDLSQDKARSGMNIGICVLDPKNNKLEFSGAKIDLLIIRDKQLKTIEPVLKSVGYNYQKAESFDFKQKELEVREGDVLYMFSDGYADQFGGPKKQKFFTQNLTKLLVDHSERSMREQELVLKQVFNEWISTFKEQIDDVLVMGIRI